MGQETIITEGMEAAVVDNHDGMGGREQHDARSQLSLPSEREEGGHWSKQLYCLVPRARRFNGYNGIAEWRVANSASPFLPSASGLNCEFIFDAGGMTFEPRWAKPEPDYLAQPSRVIRLAAEQAMIVIEPGSTRGIAIEMTHRLRPPWYLDTDYRVTPTRDTVLSEWLGVFWASYMQTPYSPVYYFLGQNRDDTNPHWISSACGAPGSVNYAPAQPDLHFAMPEDRDALLYGAASIGYARPFFGGKIEDMLFAFLFRSPPGTQIRFGYNPSGAGPGCPAWDYAFLIDNPQANQTYAFRTRAVYKPFEDINEMIDLDDAWSPS